jgi:hypothetical protein
MRRANNTQHEVATGASSDCSDVTYWASETFSLPDDRSRWPRESREPVTQPICVTSRELADTGTRSGVFLG